jgi:Zn-dependent oligopeptidase
VLQRSFSFIRNALPNREVDGICKKIKESAEFPRRIATMRQLSFGLLDMGWHGQDPTAITDVKLLKRFAATQLYPEVAENAMSTASHLSRWIFIRTVTNGPKF